nr:male-specific lethal 3 homolog isoform X2 [Cherax quadricarinatus]
MVSTRGVRVKFSEGERVLCYEPDPTKAKVLYDSKVLEVVFNKDGKGRKQIEYLIHFQGWNASWDRCVSEDFVLKDTDENRDLQRQLADKAQIKLSMKSNRVLIGGPLYKERKRKRRLSETIRETIEKERREREQQEESETSSQLLDLPTDKTALSLLENYVKFFAVRYLARTKEKRRNEIKEKDKCFLTLDLCKEVMDGIRICFDFHIETLLLYAKERRQAERLRTAQPVYSKGELDGYEPMLVDEKDASENTSVHKDEGDTEDSKAKVEASQKEEEKNKVADSIGHRLLRSKRPPSGDSNTVVEREKSAATNMACESGRSTPTTVTSGTSTAGVSGSAGTNISTSLYRGIPPQLQDWSLLPESHHDPPPPSIIYGHTHLLRLFGTSVIIVMNSSWSHSTSTIQTCSLLQNASKSHYTFLQ